MKSTNKNKFVIYKITSPSGRIYVGKTKNFSRRMSYYKRADCKSQKVLLKSILKYGWDSHSVEVIEYAELSTISDREKYWIDFYKCNLSRYPEKNGMNCTDGGEGQYGRKCTEEQKLKIGIANKGNSYKKGIKMPDHVKQALLDANIGRRLSEDHKGKISISYIESGKSLPCLVYDYKTGDFVGNYRSISEACRDLNILSVRNRAYQVANGIKNRNQTKGYVFKYA